MGEVYRARDAKLNRDVALKILPEAFASNPDRLARFRREARVLALLNHPNIAAIHGLEDSGATHALVLELVEGPTLADRLNHRPMPLTVVLPIAKQIAEALEAAHEQGIIHRDLKPANIKVRPDDVVKVLDFGLAKAYDPAATSSAEAMSSPTLTTPAMTETGMILGTAAYMSPEQARGQSVDKRADLWAFGVVLFEMLSGIRAFAGATVSDTLAAVLTAEPDWSALPAGTPASIQRLLRRLLDKNRKRRLDSAAAARVEIEDAISEPTAAALVPGLPARARSTSGVPWAWAAGAAVVVGVLTFAATTRWQTPAAAEPEWRGELLGGPAFATGSRVSPDGQTVAFQVMEDGVTQVAVMRQRSAEWATLTHDRDHGVLLDIEWSADGSSIYFDRLRDAPQGIYRVPVLGGEPRLVLERASSPVPLPDGTLLVARMGEDRRRQIFRFWPETGRLESTGAMLPAGLISNSIRAFRDGREAVFYGKPVAAPDAPDDVYALDLASHAIRRLGQGQPFATFDGQFAPPLATTPDGRDVLAAVPAGDMSRVVALPRDAASGPRTVLGLTGGVPYSLDVAPDGAIHTSLLSTSVTMLRSAVGSTSPERFVGGVEWGAAIPLPGGRILAAVLIVGQSRVVIMAPGKDPVPLLETTEETRGPLAMLGRDLVLLIVGSPPNQLLAIVSVADGRLVRRLEHVDGGMVQAVAGSPDGKTVYYATADVVWAADAAGGAPKKFHAGNGVAIDPGNQYAAISINEQAGERLVRVPLNGEAEQAIPVRSDRFRISPSHTLMSNALDARARMLVGIAPVSRFYPVGILDTRTGELAKVWPDIETDMWGGWTDDGRVLAGSRESRSVLWRFTRAK